MPELPFTPVPSPTPESPTPTNLKEIASQLKVVIQKELADLLEAAQSDVSGIAAELAPILVSAAASGDTKMTAELEAQVALLRETYRIMGSKAGWRTLKSVSNIAIGALSSGLKAALGAL